MQRVPIDYENEYKQVGEYTQVGMNGLTKSPKLQTPVTPKENYLAMLRGETPLWMPGPSDEFMITPRIIADNVARAFVADVVPLKLEEKGGKGWFGVDWVFVPSVGGSMVQPGKPLLPDVCDWENVIKFPNLDELDWEGSSKQIQPYLIKDKVNEVCILNGLFERLISFMDFEGAAMALLDEEQQDAVHGLFSKLCDFYDDLIGRYKKYYDCDMVMFHDDWGSQRAPFFSLATCREMLVPYLKRVVESCHKRGMPFHFHCCGKNELLVPAMVEAGVDFWIPQPMNDIPMLVAKYDGQINFGARPPALDPNASDDEIKAAAAAFIDLYRGHKNIVCYASMLAGNSEATAKFARDIYFLSREEYNK